MAETELEITPEQAAEAVAKLEKMREQNRERGRRFRERQGNKPRGELAPCGTVAAYRRHKRADEKPCDDCKLALKEHNAEAYARRKAEKEAAEAEIDGAE